MLSSRRCKSDVLSESVSACSVHWSIVWKYCQNVKPCDQWSEYVLKLLSCHPHVWPRILRTRDCPCCRSTGCCRACRLSATAHSGFGTVCHLSSRPPACFCWPSWPGWALPAWPSSAWPQEAEGHERQGSQRLRCAGPLSKTLRVSFNIKNPDLCF